MAEVILNRVAKGKFTAFSAGSHAAGQIHPYTIDLLKKLNYDVSALRSKSWDEFAVPGAPKLDFVSLFVTMRRAKPALYGPGTP
jgi:arsenate reductase